MRGQTASGCRDRSLPAGDNGTSRTLKLHGDGRLPTERGTTPRDSFFSLSSLASMKRVPLKRVNRERRKRLYERNFGEIAARARAMRCCGCGEPPPSDPAHSVGRKMGGCGGDRFDIVPLCRTNVYTGRVGCHFLLDNDLEAFTMRTGLTREGVRAIAARLWRDEPR